MLLLFLIFVKNGKVFNLIMNKKYFILRLSSHLCFLTLWILARVKTFEFFPRILALEKLGAVFNQIATPLRHTPRKFVIHPQSNNLIMIETDHNGYTHKTREEKKQQMAEVLWQQSLHVVLCWAQLLFH